MSKHWLVLLIFLLLPPSPLPGEAIAKVNIHEYSLENGIKLFVLEDHSVPTISYQAWYKVGSRNERPGITGISHLFEHMMFKGSKKYGPEEHARIIQANGGNLNAFTTEDVTAYFENLPADKLKLAMDLESEREANLAITPENLKSETEVVKEERRMRNDNSNFGKLIEQLTALAYQQHPYHWPVIGWMWDLNHITLEDCIDYHRKYYSPRNTTLVVVGDVDPEETCQLAKKYYGDLPPGPPLDVVITPEEEQHGERRAIYHKATQLPWLGLAYHIPEEANDDSPVLEVIDKILSSGKSSRIYRDIIRDKEMALFVFTTADLRIDPGLFFALAGDIKPGHTPEEVEEAIKAQLGRLMDEPVTDIELQKAKNQLEADFLFHLQSNFGKGAQIAHSYLFTGDPYYFEEVVDRYRSVTKDDIMRVAKKYFQDENSSVLTLLPEAGQGLNRKSAKE
jgi:predicted Zn-dependent peptidase